jgi:SSU ribosomal protein S4E
MTRHQKRLSAPRTWPIERKTQTFTVKAGAGPHGEAGVPIVILLRDVLGVVDTRREARYAIGTGGVQINGAPVRHDDRPVGLFDILSIPDRDEYYRIFPDEGGRLALTPIDPAAASSRLGRIVGKQTVDGGATQLALHDGTTLRVPPAETDTYHTKDSVIITTDTREIEAHFPYEEGALVTAVDGQHAGEIGEIETITVTQGSGPNTVRVAVDAETHFETIEPYVVVIDEQFLGGDADE